MLRQCHARKSHHQALKTDQQSTFEKEMSKNAAAGKLCSLVEENNFEMLRKWVSGGIDVNAGDYDKRTALHIAAACGAVEILRFLLEITLSSPKI